MKYFDLPICDLRYIKDAEAISEIESIFDVALLVLPKEASPEVQSALAKIERYDVAVTVYLNDADEVKVCNGITEVTAESFAGENETVLLVNGVVVVYNIPEKVNGSMLVNGIVVCQKSAVLPKMRAVNSVVTHADFERCKSFSQGLEVDRELLKQMEPRTLLLCGDNLTLAEDVTVDLLREKKPYFACGRNLECGRSVAAYVKLNSAVGGQLTIRED